MSGCQVVRVSGCQGVRVAWRNLFLQPYDGLTKMFAIVNNNVCHCEKMFIYPDKMLTLNRDFVKMFAIVKSPLSWIFPWGMEISMDVHPWNFPYPMENIRG